LSYDEINDKLKVELFYWRFNLYKMLKFEVIIKSIPNSDNNIISLLQKKIGQSVESIKECILNGLPICSWELTYDGFYCKWRIVEILIEIFQENNIDVIIKYNNKYFSLIDFIQFRNRKNIHRLLQFIHFNVEKIIQIICFKLRIRIGIFNKLPIYFHFFNECTIEDGKRIYLPSPAFLNFTGSDSSIGITVTFLPLPRYFKHIILWHEYGHYILNTPLIPFNDGKSHKVNEALANFYSCCKCKLHFNIWREFYRVICLYRLDNLKFKINNDNHCNYYEKRYDYIEEDDMEIADYVYQFYRDNGKLFLCYKELFSKYGYNKKFQWINLLDEIGWRKNKDRWEYINMEWRKDS
jgi:hypothetical protein